MLSSCKDAVFEQTVCLLPVLQVSGGESLRVSPCGCWRSPTPLDENDVCAFGIDVTMNLNAGEPSIVVASLSSSSVSFVAAG